MTIQEALNRLSYVLEQDAKGYFWDLQYWLFKDIYNAMGVRRKSKEIPILFWWDIENYEFEKMQGLIKAVGELYQYHFSVDDLLANDWECVLMDADGDFKETFDDFLRGENDEVMYLRDIEDLGFFRLNEKFTDVEIINPYTEAHYASIERDLQNRYNKGDKIGDITRDLIDKYGNLLISIDWEAK